MSGYGPATDDDGNILFVTGNSDPGTYDGVTNIQESVVKMSNTLTTVMTCLLRITRSAWIRAMWISARAECWCCPISRERRRIWRWRRAKTETCI
jgi:hypothetical protein